MTSTVTPSNTQEFEGRMKTSRDFNSLYGRTQKGPTEIKDKARADLKNKILATPAGRVMDPNMDEETLYQYANQVSSLYDLQADNYFHSNFDGIMKELRESKKGGLEKIAGADVLKANGGEKYQKVLVAADGYNKALATYEAYKAGQIKDPEELTPLAVLGVQEEKEKIKKELEGQGYNHEEADILTGLTSIAAKQGNLKKEYVDKGAEILLEKSKEKFKERMGEGKELSDYVVDVLGKMRSEGGEQFKQARNLTYAALEANK